MLEKLTPEYVESLEERFWDKVTIPKNVVSDCWLWTGYIMNTYGAIRITVNSIGITTGAHRMSYELATGINPVSQHILHSCDNRQCVNPHHLSLGTNLDNINDKIAKGRQPNGVLIKQSKLSEDQVREIRAKYVAGHTNKSALSREYGISRLNIANIINYKVWKHI